MKRIILVLYILFPLFISAQNRVTLNDGNRFLGHIYKCQDSVLVFKGFISEINSDRVKISKLTYIEGYISKSFKKAIRDYNVNVAYRNDAYTKNDIHNEKIKNQSKKHIETSIAVSNTNNNNSNNSSNHKLGYKTSAGDLIQIAGQRYVIGLGTAFAGGVLAVIGVSENSTSLSIIGGISTVVGGVISITGHFKLIEAGKAMNREAITLSASDNGIGLAINF